MEESNGTGSEECGINDDYEEETVLIRGRMSDFVSRVKVSDIVHLCKTVSAEILLHWEDLVFIAFFTYAPLILVRNNKTAAYRRAQIVSEIGKVLGLIYLVDIAVLALQQIDTESIDHQSLGIWATGIILIGWAARLTSQIKSCYLLTSTAVSRDNAKMANRAVDVVIYIATILAILDFLSIETGFALKSIFGLSGFGTLVVSLATRELMAEFFASLAIQTNNMYKVGDLIWLDGTIGTVQKAGWLNTLVRLGDEKVVRIPNSKVTGLRMANLSRTERSQVTQTLYISYDDWKKLPKLSEDIRNEVRENVPTAITDGSRAYRAQWRELSKPYLEFVVDMHFEQKSACNAYWEMREVVLACIMRACEVNDIKFAYKKMNTTWSIDK